MSKYGQYCPVAKALEILGDRWTLLIIRDLLTGTSHFNDLERGLPGISKALLAKRLQQLQQSGVIEKHLNLNGNRTTEYRLTQAGQELLNVIAALRIWGEAWAFGDPTPEDLNPVLLMWWLRNRVNVSRLPEHRVTVQFDFYGVETVTFWLILSREDVTLCLTDPGYEIALLVTADLAAFFKLWAGRISYQDARNCHEVRVEGTPKLVRGFADWFGWNTSMPAKSNLQTMSHVS